MIASTSVRLALAAVLLALPACAPKEHVSDLQIDPIENVITIAHDNTILWNGVPVSLEDLELAFKKSAATEPEPTLRYEPHFEASYEVGADVLRLIKKSGISNVRFRGNDKLPAEGQPTN